MLGNHEYAPWYSLWMLLGETNSIAETLPSRDNSGLA